MRPGGSNRAPDAAGVQEQPTISGLADFVRRPLTRVNPAIVSKVIDPETGMRGVFVAWSYPQVRPLNRVQGST